MHLFYSPEIKGKIYTFDQEESKHAVKVLRLKRGDIVYLTDGQGTLYKTVIEKDDLKKCSVRVTDTFEQYGKRDFYLHIAIAPTKNSKRFEWFLEKVTEIGVDEITPLVCDHSERTNIRHERLNKVITAAMKQSLKAYHPQLNDIESFRDFVSLKRKGFKTMAVCDENEKHHLKNLSSRESEVTVIIGPEGDFSKQELELAAKEGYVPVSLGKSRLRTETAGVVACSIVNVAKD